MSYLSDDDGDIPVVPHARRGVPRASPASSSAGPGAFAARLASSASGSPAPAAQRARAPSSVDDDRAGESHGRQGARAYGGYGGYGASDVDGESSVGGLGALGEDGGDDDDDEAALDDVRRLARAWVRERGTVDVLRWEGDLVDALFDKLEQQQKMLDTLRADPATSEDEHFKLLLVQTEMERVKYLVRSYVRARLHKVEKYAHHIALTPALHALLSGAELQHARRYAELLHTHFQSSVLDSLPEGLRRMDDTYGDGTSMVTRPNLSTPVLIYCRKDCGEVPLEAGESAILARGTTHLVKYSLVARWISLGWAEVL